MNRELLKLKKTIAKMSTPTREKEICRALQTIFHDMEVGLTEQEALQILGWDYKSRADLFGDYEKDKITVNAHENYESMIFNDNDVEIDGIDGAIVFNSKVVD